jgi:two-component system, LytTR family, response regulator
MSTPVYHALIVDDEPNAVESLRLSLGTLFRQVLVTHTCSNWQDALLVLQQQQFDLIFLDIRMPGKTGIQLARLLPQLKGKIIFVTAHEEYALEAFKCYASGYLLKPLNDEELFALVSRLLTIAAPPAAADDILGIPGSKGIDYIHINDIIYLQSEHKCTRIVLSNRVLYSSYHLGRFRDFLPAHRFLGVHRSYLVNLYAVQRYVHDQSGIVMNNEAEIPVARAMREELLQQFATLNKSGAKTSPGLY